MDRYFEKYILNDQLLLNDFNKRDSYAFSFIYNRYYNEFHLYASTLYAGTTIEPKDAVQDAFMHVLETNSVTFNELINIKAFIIIMIKNRYKNYLQHLSCERRYSDKINIIDNTFETDILENRIYNKVDEMLSLLPNDSAEILRLYIRGWKPEEISIELNKPIQTIYNKKSEAINFLKSKVNRKMLFYIIHGLS